MEERVPLLVAAIAGDIQQIKDLVKRGASPNVRGVFRNSVLHYAVQQNRLECVKFLLSIRFQRYNMTRYANAYHQTPLHVACCYLPATLEILRELLKRNPYTVNTSDYLGYFPVHMACFSENSVAVELLARAGADLNVQTFSGNFPLNIAAEQDSASCLQILLRYGANPRQSDHSCRTALYTAIANRSSACIDMLIDYMRRQDFNVLTVERETFLFAAAENGDVLILKSLLAKGLNPYAQNLKYELAINYTTNVECAEALLEAMRRKYHRSLSISPVWFNRSPPHIVRLICDTMPSLLTKRIVDYVLKYWRTNKNECFDIVRILWYETLPIKYFFKNKMSISCDGNLAEIVNICLEYFGRHTALYWIPHYVIEHTDDFLECWDGTSDHCVELLRVIASICPVYSPDVFLRTELTFAKVIRQAFFNHMPAIPASWELQFDEECEPVDGVKSLKHLARSRLRKTMGSRGPRSYSYFVSSLATLPKSLQSYMRYMDD